MQLIAFANADGLSAPFYRNEGVEGNALACSFLRIVIRRDLPCESASAAAIERWNATARVRRRVGATPPDSVLRQFVGRFQSPRGRLFDFVLRDRRLWFRTLQGREFEVFAGTESQFFLKAAELAFRFLRNGTGVVDRVQISGGSQPVEWIRVPAR